MALKPGVAKMALQAGPRSQPGTPSYPRVRPVPDCETRRRSRFFATSQRTPRFRVQ